MIYKFSDTQISVSTANTVYDKPVIRLVNPTTGVVNTTVSFETTNLYSFSVLAGSEIIIEKLPAHKVQGTGLVASPVAYRY